MTGTGGTNVKRSARSILWVLEKIDPDDKPYKNKIPRFFCNLSDHKSEPFTTPDLPSAVCLDGGERGSVEARDSAAWLAEHGHTVRLRQVQVILLPPEDNIRCSTIYKGADNGQRPRRCNRPND